MKERHSINSDAIPSELKTRSQWVWWKAEKRDDGKLSKIPMDAKNGRNASHSNPETWASFDLARAYHESHTESAGIGFVFAKDDPYVGIDLDRCVKEGVNGIQTLDDVAKWARKWIELANTYSEVSPSGTGVKLILSGKMPGNRGKRNDNYETGGVEIYPHHRFFTITGQHLSGTPLLIAHNTDALVEICDQVFANSDNDQTKRRPKENVTWDELALIEKAMNAANGHKFRLLWEGNWEGYQSQSEADLALCSDLAFWTGGDAARIDSLFRQSGLYRDKWERNDYRSWTISKAIEGASSYDPSYRSGAGASRNGSGDGRWRAGKSSADGKSDMLSPEKVITRISDLSSPSQSEIQEVLWDSVWDASTWTRAEIGRFRDRIHNEFGITRKWLEDWQKAVNDEKRKAEKADTENQSKSPSDAQPKPAQAFENEITFTEGWTAREFVKKYGKEIRYCPLWKEFVVFTGKRWEIDHGEVVVTRKVKQFIREMYRTAAEIEDLAARTTLATHAVEFDTERKYSSVIELVKSEVPIKPDAFDADPMLLNCLNGTVDLRTGERRPHRREDYLTKICPVNFDRDVPLDLWNIVISQALPDQETRDFVQRGIGYSITGYAKEEVLFFPYGPTATCKSTLLAAVQAALGDYAATADFETLLAQVTDHAGGRPKTELARLHGKRLVVSVEVNHGVKLAEGLVKWITGQDVVVARFLYGKEFEFLPSFTLWLAANHRPKVSDEDDAVWRRILQIPFTHQIPKEERDPSVKEKLRDPAYAGSAVLAWAVKGCLEWQKRGLDVPESVEKTTEEYREEMNPLRDFFDDCCRIHKEAYATPTALWEAYQKWCDDNGVRYPLRRQKFWERLQNMGFERSNKWVHGQSARVYGGIGICSEDETHT